MEKLEIKDWSAGRGYEGYPYYALRPNLHHRMRGELRRFMPARPFSHRYKFDPKKPFRHNEIVAFADQIRWLRWYMSKNRTKFRKILK